MLTILNRRELITVVSQERLFRIREDLSNAGIPCTVKMRGAARAAERARYGTAGIRQDALYSYAIYVTRSDYARAAAAIRPALRHE